MDKLRALQYFVAAAAEGSLSGAARRFEVSLPAVAKLVSGLERSLGATLFDRSTRGLSLTAAGQVYLDSCAPMLEQLAAADDAMRSSATRPRGTVVAGISAQLAQHCVLPELPGLRARYPDIQFDIRVLDRTTDAEAQGVDAFILFGWPEATDMVLRRIALPKGVICAVPAYWAAHGVPQRPEDLKHHSCLQYRNSGGTVVDLWEFERGDEKKAVAVQGWLTSNHRDVLLDMTLAGEGLARFSDLATRRYLESGQLVPVLEDWRVANMPPINLLFRPSHRRIPRVRLFIDWAIQLFLELESGPRRGYLNAALAERSDWYLRRYARASTSLGGKWRGSNLPD